MRRSDASISEQLIRRFQVGSRAGGKEKKHFGILSSCFEALPAQKSFFNRFLIVLLRKIQPKSPQPARQGRSLKPPLPPCLHFCRSRVQIALAGRGGVASNLNLISHFLTF